MVMVMMVVMVVVVIAPDGPKHPNPAIPDIAMLEIPAAAVVVMMMVVVVVIERAPRIILRVEKLCRRILVRSIVGGESAHGIGDRLQQICIGGGGRNGLRTSRGCRHRPGGDHRGSTDHVDCLVVHKLVLSAHRLNNRTRCIERGSTKTVAVSTERAIYGSERSVSGSMSGKEMSGFCVLA